MLKTNLDKLKNIYTATALGIGRVAGHTLSRLYPRESPQYSIYRRLSEPQDHSGHEGVKRNLHSFDTQDVNKLAKAQCTPDDIGKRGL